MPPGRNHPSRHESPNFTPNVPPPTNNGSLWEYPSIEPRSRINKGLLFRLPFDAKKVQDGAGGDHKVPRGWLQALKFLRSDHGIDNPAYYALAANAEWHAVTQLGTGGFGRVGLWALSRDDPASSKAGADKGLGGEPIDEIVIKQQELKPWNRERGKDGTGKHKYGDYAGLGIHWEAMIGEGLQHKEAQELLQRARRRAARRFLDRLLERSLFYTDEDTHIARIRRYRYNKEAKLCRLYLEYCPHGTLGDLVRDYKAWGQMLPLGFVWHLLLSLALALRALSGRLPADAFLWHCRNLRDEPDWPSPPSHHWLLHYDIKHANILLSYSGIEHDEADSIPKTRRFSRLLDPTRGYPSVKLGDFGVATYTSDADTFNPPMRGGSGTLCNYPPEQRKDRWQKFRDPPNFNGAQWTEKHMVWQVGKVVLDSIMGWSENHIDEELNPDLGPINEAEYERLGCHFLDVEKEFDMKKFKELRKYDSLIDLCMRCLRPKIDERPGVEELVDLAREGLRGVFDVGGDDGDDGDDGDGQRLYFRGREIRDLDVGTRAVGASPKPHEYWKVRFKDPQAPVPMEADKWEGMRGQERAEIEKMAREAGLKLSDFVKERDLYPAAPAAPDPNKKPRKPPQKEGEYSQSVNSSEVSYDESEKGDNNGDYDDDDDSDNLLSTKELESLARDDLAAQQLQREALGSQPVGRQLNSLFDSEFSESKDSKNGTYQPPSAHDGKDDEDDDEDGEPLARPGRRRSPRLQKPRSSKEADDPSTSMKDDDGTYKPPSAKDTNEDLLDDDDSAPRDRLKTPPRRKSRSPRQANTPTSKSSPTPQLDVVSAVDTNTDGLEEDEASMSQDSDHESEQKQSSKPESPQQPHEPADDPWAYLGDVGATTEEEARNFNSSDWATPSVGWSTIEDYLGHRSTPNASFSSDPGDSDAIESYLAQTHAFLLAQIKARNIKLEKGEKRKKEVFAKKLREADVAAWAEKRAKASEAKKLRDAGFAERVMKARQERQKEEQTKRKRTAEDEDDGDADQAADGSGSVDGYGPRKTTNKKVLKKARKTDEDVASQAGDKKTVKKAKKTDADGTSKTSDKKVVKKAKKTKMMSKEEKKTKARQWKKLAKKAKKKKQTNARPSKKTDTQGTSGAATVAAAITSPRKPRNRRVLDTED
ncbi:uncharacterized protein AB675_11222 [Cyphellophora attinorum]|uniref:Protein kinase domain-containing protein n=1 Tax=Cyphellophora attinorum TaxID=1664694 RepID=A0A0N1NVX3_9EURO|nr:uncharacterized protein AB675_11222 [Phialophora attinorum]KPI34344.1 hypothetical protein AB675_11222 [Phialophora attinorum]